MGIECVIFMSMNDLKRLAFFFGKGIMGYTRKMVLGIMILVLPVLSHAHGYWLDILGSGKVNEAVRIQICFGDIDEYSVRHREAGDELKNTAGFKLFVVDADGKRVDCVLRPKPDCWEAVFVPRKRGVYRILGLNDSLPVVDRSEQGGQNVRPIEYLCAAYTVGSDVGVEKPDQFLDLLVAVKGKLVLVKAFKDKKPSAVNTKLRVFNPENWEKALSVDVQGEVVFAPTMKGLYIIRQDWNDVQPGTWMGKSYVAVRYRCNYSLWVR